MTKNPISLSLILEVSLNPIDDIFHIFDELVIGTPTPAAVRWTPKADIYLTEEDLIIEIELPGVNKADLSVSLSRNGLYIEGIRHRPARSRRGISFYNLEIDYGPFERRIYFPCPVDPHRMTATFEQGVLTIELKRIRPVEYEIPIEEG
ncbi:hypothetical protein DRP53_00370 [candidate division WOR-3 bacterium]|uniref:SHSP domain-containing protein n=1 Tax=candidate division WOR-3 bacterium TaxID=2052148 RepID=A0A660SLV1_UNCW3|nr:MAG: hypothetical protein DRP53_00370 [candidate division WOR-3 bacterium]